MSIKRIMKLRLCLSFGAALTVASFLVSHRAGPAPNPEGAGIVYVYFPSLCEAPGDARHCEEVSRPHRPSFESMAACFAFADIELKQEQNPRLLASCLRQREV